MVYFSGEKRHDGTFESFSSSSAEQRAAGVQSFHEPWQARELVERYRASLHPGSGEAAAAASRDTLKAMAILIVAIPAVLAVILGIDSLPSKWRNIVSAGEEKVHAVAAAKVKVQRAGRFGDFSKPADWPADAQAIFAKAQDRDIVSIMADRVKIKGDLPPEDIDRLGGAVWGILQPKGKDIPAALDNLAAPKWWGSRPAFGLETRVLAMSFLRRQCSRGVEVACLDAARFVAGGSLLGGLGSVDDAKIRTTALAELPTQGPLVSAPAVKEMRERIASTPAGGF